MDSRALKVLTGECVGEPGLRKTELENHFRQSVVLLARIHLYCTRSISVFYRRRCLLGSKLDRTLARMLRINGLNQKLIRRFSSQVQLTPLFSKIRVRSSILHFQSIFHLYNTP